MVTMQLCLNRRPNVSAGSKATLRSLLGWIVMASYLLFILCCAPSSSSLLRLFETTVGLLLVLKLCALIQTGFKNLKLFPTTGILTYLAIWPGVNPYSFQRRVSENNRLTLVPEGVAYMMLGLGLSLAAMISLYRFKDEAVGWLGIASLLSLIHLGFSNLLTTFVRFLGWNVKPLFIQPLKSVSLDDFWSHRWNIAFVEMNRMLFLRPLFRFFGRNGTIFGTFVISGLFHELAISFPSGSGYGLPLLYFVLQGGLVMLETKLSLEQWPIIGRRIWTWACLILPLPLLFHSAFRAVFILPLYQNLNSLFL